MLKITRPKDASSESFDPVSRRFGLAIATGFGVGLLPKAPGTFGSTLAFPIFVLLSPLPLWLQLVTWLGLGVIGIWASGIAGVCFGVQDDGRIVIDEVIGQWLSLLPLVPLGAGIARENWAEPKGLFLFVTGFVAFRCFDIAKPGWVGRAERAFQGGLGVMMDDVVAGAFAAGVVAIVTLALQFIGAGAPW